MVILDQINRKLETSVESGSGWVYVNSNSKCKESVLDEQMELISSVFWYTFFANDIWKLLPVSKNASFYLGSPVLVRLLHRMGQRGGGWGMNWTGTKETREYRWSNSNGPRRAKCVDGLLREVISIIDDWRTVGSRPRISSAGLVFRRESVEVAGKVSIGDNFFKVSSVTSIVRYCCFPWKLSTSGILLSGGTQVDNWEHLPLSCFLKLAALVCDSSSSESLERGGEVEARDRRGFSIFGSLSAARRRFSCCSRRGTSLRRALVSLWPNPEKQKSFT